MPWGIQLIAAVIGAAGAFGLFMGPAKIVKKPVAVIGTVAIIALSLAFLGYGQALSFVSGNGILSFIMALGVGFAGVTALTDLLGM